jgi:hypothetical protein
MTAEEHNRTLGTLYLIYGAMHGLTLVGLLLLVFVVKFATPSAALLPMRWLAVAIVAFIILFLFVGLFPVLAGAGFRKQASWVKPFALALALVSLVNIPIGTALGIYTLRFFKSEGGARLYGGKGAVSGERELQQAMSRTRPLMNWANRLKQ